MTLRAFATDFFLPGRCRWIERREKKAARKVKGGKRRTRKLPAEPTLKSYRRNLVNYILPRWGYYLLSFPTTRAIDDWLLDLADFRSGEELKGQTKNHILKVLRIVFQEAKEAGLIAENPAAEIEPFDNDWDSPDVLTLTELLRLFPVDRAKLLKVWGASPMWACYFLLASVTGLRPGEIRALRWGDWYRSLYGLVVSRAVEDGGAIKDRLKAGTPTGDIKPVLLTDRAEQELLLWEAACIWTEPADLLFCRSRGKPFQRRRTTAVFQAALEAAEIRAAGRRLVPDSLRHGFDTDMLERLPMHIVQILMGHRTEKMTRHYNHPDAERALKAVQDARPLLAERWRVKPK